MSKKDEMMEEFYNLKGEKNYEEAMQRIKAAMSEGEPYTLLPKESYQSEFNWWCTSETLSRLIRDGFKVNEVWQPEEYWSIEWGYDDE